MKIWPKQFHTKQCSAISSPFTSVLFAIFLAFSTGGKFLRPSQTPGGDICIVLKKHFGTSGWCWRWGSQVLGTSRLPLHCSPWSDRLIGTHVSRWLHYYVYLCLSVFVFSVCALPVPDRQMELPATLHVLGSLPEQPPNKALGNSLQVIFAFFRCVCNL